MGDWSDQLILVRDKKSGLFQDQTGELVAFTPEGHKYALRFRNSRQTYRYNAENICVARSTELHDIPSNTLIEVRGAPWQNAERLEYFPTRVGTWTRVHYRTSSGAAFRTYPSEDVSAITNARSQPRVDEIMGYFESVVAAHPADDPLINAFSKLKFVHPESALASYLAGTQPASAQGSPELIFPFASNLSQREALAQALANQISVIEGPPGTGKTQTILNLVANIVREPRATVAVVSFNNAAVDNVFEKLTSSGYGFIAAPLGSREKRDEFLAGQGSRNQQLAAFLREQGPMRSSPDELGRLGRLVHRVHELERDRAQLRSLLDEVVREQKRYQALHSDANQTVLPARAATWTSTRLLELLAEIELRGRQRSRSAELRWRLRRRWRYRLSARIDIESPEFTVAVQARYFATRLAELEALIAHCDAELASPELSHAAQHMEALSLGVMRQALLDRYRVGHAPVYSAEDLWRRRDQFSRNYPVLLSTCHSLPSAVGPGRLVDYLIIDEASQVNLAVAVLAMSFARNVIVVGDTRQLPHIVQDVGGLGLSTELQAYDFGQHNALSSLLAVYGDELPRTMLREHYRCDPRIIDFCNRKFYGGQLIPMRAAGDEPALAVIHTAPGSHSRSLSAGGHINQREIDVMLTEAIPAYAAGVRVEDIGVITPFREQANLIADAIPGVEADTVHKFQGREKPVVMMSTVIDASHSDTRLATFADDPRLINVAVSRAQDQLVVVTNPDLPQESGNLRDLVEYVAQRGPGAVAQSSIVSIFDVLYTEYAQTLRTLASRLRGVVPYRSEEAMMVTLQQVLADDKFQHLGFHYQVLLGQLLLPGAQLSRAEESFVRNRSSVDFVIFNRTTERVLGVIEVDGFTYHADSPEQLRRDALKDAILARHGIALLRLPTTGSGEGERLRDFLTAL